MPPSPSALAVKSHEVLDEPRRVYDLAARYSWQRGRVHMTGVQTLVRVLRDQLHDDRERGLRTAALVSGYEGSPLAGFDIELGRAFAQLGDIEIVHRPAVNEELGVTAVMGSQLASTFDSFRYDGVIGVWYGKAPGLDRSVDALRHANYAGTSPRGGAVAFVGDDPTAKSSTLPSASEGLLADIGLPVLVPGNLAEVLELGRHAIALSRYTGGWTALKIVTSVADGEGTIDLAPFFDPVLPSAPRRTPVSGHLLTPVTLERESAIFDRLDVAARYADANEINERVSDPTDPWIALVASGPTFRCLLDALDLLGVDFRDLAASGLRVARIGMPFPLAPKFAEDLAAGVKQIVILEERKDLIERQLLDLVGRRANAPRILGRRDAEGRRWVPMSGSLDSVTIARLLHPLLSDRLSDRLRPLPPAPPDRVAESSPNRQPWFCSGCPHSVSTVVPAGTKVGAGIGCHTLVMGMPRERVGDVVSITQMGGEGAQWIGIAPFVDDAHLVQNVGDGTLFHSASLAIRAAVAAGVNLTFKILYNGAVAMTGGQRAVGAQDPATLARSLLLEGVVRVVISTEDPRRYRGADLPNTVEVVSRGRLLQVQGELASTKGVTVLIHEQECANELRRARKRGIAPQPRERIVINERVCEGCGDCQVKSNCLSLIPVETTFGTKTRVDESTCNTDLSCLEGDCPAFGLAPKNEKGETAIPLSMDSEGLPDPPSRAPQDLTIRLAGIGGTGIVTTANILATAFLLDGKHVWGLDQTGLSQKAGAVVSDLRVSTEPIEGSNVVEGHFLDLLLAADLLAASRTDALKNLSPERTMVVGSTAVPLTGPMILGAQSREIRVDELRASLDRVTRAQDNRFVDADRVVQEQLGSPATVNVFLLGFAFQHGALPVTVASMEQALTLNGVAVEANLRSFRLGRHWALGRIASPLPASNRPDGALVAAREISGRRSLPGALENDVTERAAELIRYQGPRLAERFLDLVEAATVADEHAGGDGTFPREVASGAYKLFAYKDEYEVARLLLDHPATDGSVTWLLHPPFLRALGLKRKIRLGRWARPLLALLRAGRRLRGTPLDPFGRSEIRRRERLFAAEYETTIRRLLPGLDSGRLGTAIRIARLPAEVRGYEEVKLAAMDRYEEKMKGLLRELEQEAAVTAVGLSPAHDHDNLLHETGREEPRK